MDEIKLLLNNLDDSDIEVKRQAIEMLGEAKARESIPKLIDLFEIDNWRVRKTIVEALGKIKDVSSIPALITALKDEAIEVHSTAIDSLLQFSDQAIPYLLNPLNDEETDVRILSANTLGFISSDLSAETLLKRLKEEKDINVRYALIESLGKIGNPSSVDYLIKILKNEEFYIQIVIVMALSEIKSIKACPVLISLIDNEMLRTSIIEALGNIGAEVSLSPILKYIDKEERDINEKIVVSIVKIFKKFKSEDTSGHNESSIIKEICKNAFERDNNIEILFDLLRVGEKIVKSSAVEILTWLEEDNIGIELIELLGDKEYYVQVKEALLKICIIEYEPLLEFINHPNYKIRQGIIEVLGLVADNSIEDTLIKILNDDEVTVVKSAVISALGWIQSEKSLKILTEYLNSENESLRYAAIGTFSLIGNKEVISFCKENIGSDDKFLLSSCIQILGYIGDKTNLEILKKVDVENQDVQVKIVLVDALGNLKSEESVDMIIKLLNKSSNQVKEHIVDALIKFNDKKVIPVLLNLLKTDDMWIKYFVVKALGHIGDSNISDELLDLLEEPIDLIKIITIESLIKLNINFENKVEDLLNSDDSDVKVAAIKAVGCLGFVHQRKKLYEFINDDNWKIRSQAIESLSLIPDKETVDVLIDNYDDEESLIKKKIIKSLANIKDQKCFDFILNASEEDYEEVCYKALSKFDSKFLTVPIENFEIFEDKIKIILIRLIGDMGDANNFNFLREQLVSLNNLIKFETIKTIEKLKDKRFIKYLIPIAFPDESVINIANITIQKLRRVN